jgi:photosystem II stability/assembly factor-like uncharacterized protein
MADSASRPIARPRQLPRALVLGMALLAAALAPARPLADPARPAEVAIAWEPLGFAGYEFTSLYTVPGNACVVAWTALGNGGIGVSTDCGDQYARLFLLSAHDVTAQNENVGYVAAGTIGMAKTLDTGSNWYDINDGLPPSHDARAVLLHVAHPESVFCALYNGGVFRGGPKAVGNDTIRWAAMNDGLLDLRVRALARVRGGTFMLAATDGGIFRWAGGLWTPVAPGVVANALVIDAADSSRVLAATEQGVLRSTNFGLTWLPSSTNLPLVPLNDIARRTDGPQVWYVGTRGQGLWESVDGGSSWRKFGPDLPGDNDVRAVLCTVGAPTADAADVYAGTRADGLFRAGYSTPVPPTSWGRVKDLYRR